MTGRTGDATIRRATGDDAPALARLISPLGYPITADDVRGAWDAWTAERNEALVAIRDGRVVGVVTLGRIRVLHRPRPLGRITSLAVEPEARGRGIGRALVRAAEARLLEIGCRLLEVTSHRRRTEAHAFYLHLGFERTSHRFQRALRSDPTPEEDGPAAPGAPVAPDPGGPR